MPQTTRSRVLAESKGVDLIAEDSSRIKFKLNGRESKTGSNLLGKTKGNDIS